MLAHTRIKAIVFAAAALSLAASADAQQSRTAALASSQSATIVNQAESGRVAMARSASDSCTPGDANFRRQVFPIHFQHRFANTGYSVMLGISGLDVNHGRNVRIDTAVQSRNLDGMTIVALTWCDTIIESANIDYLAVGRRAPN